MRTELLLLMVIIAINSHPYLRKLEDTTVTEESCKKLGKDYKIKKAICKASDNNEYTVTSQDECKGGTWKDGYCSANSITDKDKCEGTPSYTAPADGQTAATCTVTVDSNVVQITDADRLADENKCKEKLFWTDSSCSVATVKEKAICETANPTFTVKSAECVDKKSDSEKSSSASTSFNSFLSFKFALVLVTYLLF